MWAGFLFCLWIAFEVFMLIWFPWNWVAAIFFGAIVGFFLYAISSAETFAGVCVGLIAGFLD